MNEDEKARFLDDHMDAEELKQIHWRASKNTEKPALVNAARASRVKHNDR